LGDLNFLPGAEEYEYLINSKHFMDLAKTNRAHTKKSGRNGRPPLTVDYIFVRQAHKYFGASIPYRLSGEGFALVDSKNPSDHEPVLVELCFEPVE
jgi:endonuclease/exonuclease/phosphatase family metal-dependent hydrolase